jgi:uracil-DNA glycosylase family 4
MSQALAVIAEEVRSCTNCRLHEGTKNGVPGEGNPNAEILFVGEGPGFNEDAQGRPFVGAAGKLLDEMLTRAGLSRDEVFITNVVKHRPPGNRDPMPDEIAACGLYLQRQIAAIKPILIVTLGRFSMATFFGPQARITQMHGRLRAWGDIAAYACFHPAAALRQPKYREGLEEDFDKLPRVLEAARKRAAERAAARAAGETEAPSQGDINTDTQQQGGQTPPPTQPTLF